MTRKYDDMIDLPHHVSKKYPQMPISKRAAQFAPFEALNGYKEEIEELVRYVDSKQVLSEDQRDELDEKLRKIILEEEKHPRIKITYFEEDEKKDGGKVKTVVGKLEKVDVIRGSIVLTENNAISLRSLTDIEEDIE